MVQAHTTHANRKQKVRALSRQLVLTKAAAAAALAGGGGGEVQASARPAATRRYGCCGAGAAALRACPSLRQPKSCTARWISAAARRK